MSTKTKAEMTDLVMKRLQISHVGESADEGDGQVVRERYEMKHAEMIEDGMVNWDEDNVPDYGADAVSIIVANGLTGDFEAPPALVASLAKALPSAISTLYRFQAKPKSESPVPAEYF